MYPIFLNPAMVDFADMDNQTRRDRRGIIRSFVVTMALGFPLALIILANIKNIVGSFNTKIRNYFWKQDPFAFQELPEDVQGCVVDYLGEEDLGSIVLVSKQMSSMAKNDCYWKKLLKNLLTECYDGSFKYVRRKAHDKFLPLPFSERLSPLDHSALVSWYSDWGDFFNAYPLKMFMSFNAMLAMRKEDTVPDWLSKHTSARLTYMEAGRAIFRIWRFEEEFAKIMGQCIDCRDLAKHCKCWRKAHCKKWKRMSRPGYAKSGIEAMPRIRLFYDETDETPSFFSGYK